jgi:hypothetical protein
MHSWQRRVVEASDSNVCRCSAKVPFYWQWRIYCCSSSTLRPSIVCRSVASYHMTHAPLLCANRLTSVLVHAAPGEMSGYFYLFWLIPLSSGTCGYLALLLSSACALGQRFMSSRLKTEVGGAKRLHAMSAIGAAVVLFPIALFSWVIVCRDNE